jgi:SAM-dependent methyltransferase
MRLSEDFTRRSKIEDVGRWHVTRFVEAAAESIPKGARLLDAGAGECAYKRFFGHCAYVGIDLGVGDRSWTWSNIDTFARLDALPLADGSIDAVLCTQVIEHVEQPRAVVRELFRVLKPGGALYLTAPMSQAEHQQPRDFFRFTSFGLASVLRGAGFDRFDVRPLGGLPARFAWELPRIMGLFAVSGAGRARPFRALLWPVKAATFVFIRLAQRLLIWADRFDKDRSDPFGWSVVARK